MSHYAKIENGKVTQVIVAEQDFINTQQGQWVQTSYNTSGGIHRLGGTPLRGNYAGIGMIYDEVNDVFYCQQPYPSWILNNITWRWEPPVPYPTPNELYKLYKWDEATLTWIE